MAVDDVSNLGVGRHLHGLLVDGVHPVDPAAARLLLEAEVVDGAALGEDVALKHHVK